MAWKRNKDEGFDAVHAAQELEQAERAEGAGDAPSTEQYIRTLEVELEGVGTILTQTEALLQRAQAKVAEQDNEIERIKKRLQDEADQKVESRVAAVIDELLDVGDDLGRAILSAREMNHNPEVVAGIELVRQSFGKRLQKLGVSRMEALGARFDPALHEAVSMMAVDDPAQDGVVIAVLREGYALNNRIIREARVAVGKLGAR